MESAIPQWGSKFLLAVIYFNDHIEQNPKRSNSPKDQGNHDSNNLLQFPDSKAKKWTDQGLSQEEIGKWVDKLVQSDLTEQSMGVLKANKNTKEEGDSAHQLAEILISKGII